MGKDSFEKVKDTERNVHNSVNPPQSTIFFGLCFGLGKQRDRCAWTCFFSPRPP